LLEEKDDIKYRVRQKLADAEVTVEEFAETTFSRAKVKSQELAKVVREVAPDAMVIGTGDDSVVYKGVGNPLDLSETYRLADATGWQGVIHTRLATESAVDADGAHPYSVRSGLSLVHNGSFANYATVRRDLEDKGIEFDSDNDTEVAARYIAYQMEEEGDDLDTALKKVSGALDGFFTLLVTTEDGFAVARDEFAT